MRVNDSEPFQTLMQGVYDFYGKDLSQFALSVWWQAMRVYDLAAVTDALSRHCVNPDTGQFLPKPADSVKMLQGSTQDAALVAWSKVDRAVREVGPYQSVVFDDFLVHRVIYDMGSWIKLCDKKEDEWPFVRNEFVNRYRGYRSRSETPEYMSVLIGIIEADNRRNGFQHDASPILIGNVEQAKQVMAGGTHKPLIHFTPLRMSKVNGLHGTLTPKPSCEKHQAADVGSNQLNGSHARKQSIHHLTQEKIRWISNL